MAGFILKPIQGGEATDVIYYAMGDLKGNIPQSVVNTATQKNPLVIDGLRKVVAKLDLSKYATVHIDPTPLAPASESVEFSTAITPEAALERKSHHHHHHHHTTGGQREHAPRELMHALDVAFESVLRDSGLDSEKSGTSEWSFVETRKDVTISRKVSDGSPIHSFKGEGIIQRPLEEILDNILDVQFRPKYDSMCKKIQCVREYEDGVNLIHSTHSTQQCLLKAEREFVFVSQYRVDKPTGRHLVMAKSVDCTDLVPLTPDVVRGEIVAAGWVLIPKGKYTLVTYVVQVDVKGLVPVAVVNAVSVRQPLCIHYLRQAMEEERGQGLTRKGSSASTWST